MGLEVHVNDEINYSTPWLGVALGSMFVYEL
jgi:hypothetical protein